MRLARIDRDEAVVREQRAGSSGPRAFGSRSAQRAPARRTATRSGPAARSAHRPNRSLSASRARRATTGRRSTGNSRSARPPSARHSATANAADDDSPAPIGTVPLISSADGGTSTPAPRSSATAPRTNPRHPTAGATASSANASRSPRSSADAVIRAIVCALESPRQHRDPGCDRKRQREAAVVVGVLSDQVDAPGRERGTAISHRR